MLMMTMMIVIETFVIATVTRIKLEGDGGGGWKEGTVGVTVKGHHVYYLLLRMGKHILLF